MRRQHRRQRSTKADMAEFYDNLLVIVHQQQPMTVRQTFYQCVVTGLIDKTEQEYDRVQKALVTMRRSGAMPYDWITDSTRWVFQPTQFDTPQEAARHAASLYRKNLWMDAACRLEVWIEKDALSGVVSPVTYDEYGIGLYVARGFASLSYLHRSAMTIEASDKPTVILHLGDYDPSGQLAAHSIEDTLRKLAPNSSITFTQLAVTPQQIAQWQLPTRPTKIENNAHVKKTNWKGDSVELDAIAPDDLRSLLRAEIEYYMPAEQLKIAKAAEESEREIFESWAKRLKVKAS